MKKQKIMKIFIVISFKTTLIFCYPLTSIVDNLVGSTVERLVDVIDPDDELPTDSTKTDKKGEHLSESSDANPEKQRWFGFSKAASGKNYDVLEENDYEKTFAYIPIYFAPKSTEAKKGFKKENISKFADKNTASSEHNHNNGTNKIQNKNQKPISLRNTQLQEEKKPEQNHESASQPSLHSDDIPKTEVDILAATPDSTNITEKNTTISTGSSQNIVNQNHQGEKNVKREKAVSNISEPAHKKRKKT
ncbi:hypothetical protein EDEG_03097 [Edhazardia aedis USNM 41457]|uniref:Uncharacterized protein n=1 Tax=Edhazardia aedis (strain USNM 41457) TaxID=1003232 RepID=J9DM69_EDHAE|nr:hypothetical protein EDEG_03097 [Edhazardia aedis USNM 41457]|eukprot:EJW02477.1 hypothetical protein EDEG_03097 [Edhazardia aedis USNM 41457]